MQTITVIAVILSALPQTYCVGKKKKKKEDDLERKTYSDGR